MQLKKVITLLTFRLFSKENFKKLIALTASSAMIHLLLGVLNNKISQHKHAEEMLLLLEKEWSCFLEQTDNIINVVGNKIVNYSYFKYNLKNLSLFLNTIQYWSIFAEKNSIFQTSSLIWINNARKPIGALGLLSPDIFKANREFIDECKGSADKLMLSKPHINKFYTSLENHIEACKSFYTRNTYIGSLIIHISPDTIKSNIFKHIARQNYQPTLVAIIDQSGNIITTSNEKFIYTNEQSAFIKSNQPTSIFSKIYGKLFYKYAQDFSYVFIVGYNRSLFLPNNFINTLKIIPHTIIIFFLIISMINLTNNIIFNYEKKFIRLILQLAKKFPISRDIKREITDHQDLINFSFYLKYLFKNLDIEMTKLKKITANIEELKINNAQLKLELQQANNFKIFLKMAYLSNLKTKKSISEQLKDMLLIAITKLEETANEQKFLDTAINNPIVHLATSIGQDLKNIFNLQIKSKKELTDPIVLIENIINSLMIHASIREVSITSSVVKNLTPIYIDHSKLQLVIMGLISQTIDLTPRGGIISLELAKVIDNDDCFFKINIKDSSYSSALSGLSQNCFLTCDSITMSNIIQLVESEEGHLTIEHNSNCGKTITIKYPYLTVNDKEDIKLATYGNIYNLR